MTGFSNIADGAGSEGEFGLAACVRIVEAHDRPRSRLLRLADHEGQGHLAVLFAFNLEIARIPWLVEEPGLGAIRLQWWVDTLEDAALGRAVPRGEVVTPLALRLRQGIFEKGALVEMVEARRHDLDHAMFADGSAFRRYLAATGGNLVSLTGRALGAPQSERALLYRLGRVDAFARFIAALPELRARGRQPLPAEIDARTLAELAREAAKDLAALRLDLRQCSPEARLAGRFAWLARPLLRRILADPEAALGAGIRLGSLAREFALQRAVFLGP